MTEELLADLDDLAAGARIVRHSESGRCHLEGEGLERRRILKATLDTYLGNKLVERDGNDPHRECYRISDEGRRVHEAAQEIRAAVESEEFQQWFGEVLNPHVPHRDTGMLVIDGDVFEEDISEHEHGAGRSASVCAAMEWSTLEHLRNVMRLSLPLLAGQEGFRGLTYAFPIIAIDAEDEITFAGEEWMEGAVEYFVSEEMELVGEDERHSLPVQGQLVVTAERVMLNAVIPGLNPEEGMIELNVHACSSVEDFLEAVESIGVGIEE